MEHSVYLLNFCVCNSISLTSLLLHHEVAVHIVHAVVGRVGLDEIDVVAPEPLDDRVLVLAVGPE